MTSEAIKELTAANRATIEHADATSDALAAAIVEYDQAVEASRRNAAGLTLSRMIAESVDVVRRWLPIGWD